MSRKPPVFISTWSFGKGVNDAAIKTWKRTGQMADAIERGIWDAESDPENDSVGLGGIPNAEGIVQVDALFMSGPDHKAGAVCGLESILHPISVARQVMQRSRHVMLCGDGAKQFARECGFEEAELLTSSQRAKWQEKLAAGKIPDHHPLPLEGNAKCSEIEGHDTVTLLGLDPAGDLYGGCSTSGWGYKMPGRVGDSPIVGGGLYVDNETGAAGATGTGENVMRYGASFQIVEAMRAGDSPQLAVEKVIARIIESDSLPAEKLAINFIALNKKGEIGAAGTSRGFQYAVATEHSSELFNAKSFSETDIEPGGNKQ